MTLTGAISIMCEAKREPGWGMCRREYEMRKHRQCLQATTRKLVKVKKGMELWPEGIWEARRYFK